MSTFPVRETFRRVQRRRDRWARNEDFQPIGCKEVFRPSVEKWMPILPLARTDVLNRFHPLTGHAYELLGREMNLWRATASMDATGPAFRIAKPMGPFSPDLAGHFLHLIVKFILVYKLWYSSITLFSHLGRREGEGHFLKNGSQLHLHSSLNTVQVRCNQRRRSITGAALPKEIISLSK